MNISNHNTKVAFSATAINLHALDDELDAAADFLEALYMAAVALTDEEQVAIQRVAEAARRHIFDARKRVEILRGEFVR